MAVGERIKALRKQKKLTQKVLAERSGIAEITIRQYEAGDYEPKLDNLRKIAQGLGVEISDILPQTVIDSRLEGEALNGLRAILESIYQTEFDWHCEVDRDGVPEYDGDFSVNLKNSSGEWLLSKKDFEALFSLVCQNIPAYIKLISDFEVNRD